MASPELERRVGQLRHDVDDVYELLDATNQTVAILAATQREHGTRLDKLQQSVDGHTTVLNEHTVKLDEQGAKLDMILALLRGTRPSE